MNCSHCNSQANGGRGICLYCGRSRIGARGGIVSPMTQSAHTAADIVQPDTGGWDETPQASASSIKTASSFYVAVFVFAATLVKIVAYLLCGRIAIAARISRFMGSQGMQMDLIYLVFSVITIMGGRQSVKKGEDRAALSVKLGIASLILNLVFSGVVLFLQITGMPPLWTYLVR